MKSPAVILRLLATAAGALLTAVSPAATAAASAGLSVPNAASSVWDTDPSKVGIELQIMNSGVVAAEDVRVTAVNVRAGALAAPTVFPIALGNIAPQASALFDLVLSVPRVDGTAYLLTIRGTFRAAGVQRRFSLGRAVTPSAAAPGPITPKNGSSTVTSGVPAMPAEPSAGGRPRGFGPNAATPMLIPPGPPRAGPPPTNGSAPTMLR